MKTSFKFNKGNNKKNIGRKLFLAAFPFLMLYGLFCYLPITGWAYAFYDYRPGIDLAKCDFVGFKHFISMFQNPVLRREFLQVVKNTLFFGCMNVVTSFIPMLFAILVNELKPGWLKKIVLTGTTIPHFIGWVLVYAVAFSMFSTEGFINSVLIKIGVLDAGVNHMASTTLPRIQMWLYNLWKGLGWSAIIYVAGLGSIDQQLYEAAAIDGAGRFAKIKFVTIPGLMPTFITLLIMSIGNFLSVGMEQYLVFSNAFNSDYIQTLDLYVYNQGIMRTNISYSTAVGIYKSVIGITLLLIANYLSGKIRDEKIF